MDLPVPRLLLIVFELSEFRTNNVNRSKCTVFNRIQAHIWHASNKRLVFGPETRILRHTVNLKVQTKSALISEHGD